ncbi:ADP-ribosylation factor-like protein 13A isoform X2 [Athene cunicularia]|uniref:ADP-ribosylation factor-like protein 13A isoform X2 n=1 Tax=Athene cunicularia TaxID=194338 RepID=UPI000EF73860|nr:ADP-ribosylation factor-like protein 13A isoform X2 [Athene cunicularia]
MQGGAAGAGPGWGVRARGVLPTGLGFVPRLGLCAAGWRQQLPTMRGDAPCHGEKAQAGRSTETRRTARFVGAEERPSLRAGLPSMFHLFSHCWSWLQAIQEPIRKVTLLVLGLDNAGKTSVIMDIERVTWRGWRRPARS